MDYIRFFEEKFETFSVKLPFYLNGKYLSIDTTFKELKALGYFKYKEIKPVYDVYKQKIDKVEIVKLDEDNATTKYTYIDLSPEELKEVEAALNKFKEDKKQEIKKFFDKTIENLDGGLNIPNIGVVDCGEDHLRNVSNLVDMLEETNMPSITFRLYNNTFKELNLEELKNIRSAIRKSGLDLYAKKWELESKIKLATTKAEIDSIKWEFKND